MNVQTKPLLLFRIGQFHGDFISRFATAIVAFCNETSRIYHCAHFQSIKVATSHFLLVEYFKGVYLVWLQIISLSLLFERLTLASKSCNKLPYQSS